MSTLSKQTQVQARELISLAKQSGLFIVPVGELESWLDLGTSQKNKWIVLALDALHEDQCPDQLRQFVREIIEYLTA